MAKKIRRPFRKEKRPKKPDDKGFWSTYIRPLLKKAWESTMVKAVTVALFALSGFLYYNFYQNPFIDFKIEVEVLDENTRRGILNADIYIQNTAYHFTTDSNGIGVLTMRVRKKEPAIILTCTAHQHEIQEKIIDVPLTPKPEFSTRFILGPSN